MAYRTKVLGRPGTGKTSRILEIYMDMVKSKQYRIEDIVVCSFRRSAASDLKNAIRDAIPWIDEETLHVQVSTIHSQCYRLIAHPKLMTENDYKDFVTEYGYSRYIKVKGRDIDTHRGEWEEMTTSGDPFDAYSWCRTNLCPPEKAYRYPSYSKCTLKGDRLSKFFSDYDEFKSMRGKVDYTDMIQIVLEQKIHLRAKVIIVDEFQDLTPQMFSVFEMWERSQMTEQTIIAGDPHQSIYSFFGGSPEFFENWMEDKRIVLEHTFRLPTQIKNFGDRILIVAGMQPEPITARDCYDQCITKMRFNDRYPYHGDELHLVRCNYQIYAIAMMFAEAGKVFSTLSTHREGWTSQEVDLANAIIALKNGMPLSIEMKTGIASAFPAKLLNLPCGQKEFVVRVDDTVIKWKPPAEIIEALRSEDPTNKMIKSSEMFLAKINGVKNRKELIPYMEARLRKIMTIHASKGLEAAGVFLHTGITDKVREGMTKNKKESQAEARVWYVGLTRTKEHLYIVTDKGDNYVLPAIPPQQVFAW